MRCKHCQTNCLLFMTTFKKRIDKKQQILILWVNLYIEIYNTLYKIRSLVKLLKYNEYYQNFTYNIKLLTRTVQFTPASYKYKFFWFKSNISTFQCNETRFFFLSKFFIRSAKSHDTFLGIIWRMVQRRIHCICSIVSKIWLPVTRCILAIRRCLKSHA